MLMRVVRFRTPETIAWPIRSAVSAYSAGFVLEAAGPQPAVRGRRGVACCNAIVKCLRVDDDIERTIQEHGRDQGDDLPVHVEITAPVKCGKDVPDAGLPEVIANAAVQRPCL